MRIARLHHPVTTLGYGVRAGIWTQGCRIRCSGCMSLDTWSATGGTEYDIGGLAEWLRELPGDIDGLSISGGEPTHQQDLLALVDVARDIARERGEEWDILVFTGMSEQQLDDTVPELRTSVDALVVGPFVAELQADDALAGSSNQTVHLRTEVARERYSEVLTKPRESRLEAQVVDGRISLIGIPLPGALAALEQQLSARGVSLRQASWRRSGSDALCEEGR